MYIFDLNTFEVSILRILAKKHNPMRISYLIDGFPDYYIDNVLLAISNLNYQDYISFSHHNNSSEVLVFLNKGKRKEVLKIIDPLPNPMFLAQSHVLVDIEKGKKTDSHHFHGCDPDKEGYIEEQIKSQKKNNRGRFLEVIKNRILPHHNQQQYTNNTSKSGIQPLFIKSLVTFSLIFLGFISTLSMAEFAGDNYSTDIIYDRNMLNYQKDTEQPIKYRWYFGNEYLRDTNSSSSSFIHPSHIQQALYRCSHDNNYSY